MSKNVRPTGGISATWMHVAWVLVWMDGMCISPMPAVIIYWLVIVSPNGGISTWMHVAWIIDWMDGMCIPPVPAS